MGDRCVVICPAGVSDADSKLLNR